MELKMISIISGTFLLVVAGFAAAFFILQDKIATSEEANMTSPYVKQYNLPKNTMPNALVIDKQTIWIGGSNLELIELNLPGENTTDNPTVLTHNIPIQNKPSKDSTSPLMIWTMVQDKEGKIWASVQNQKRLFIFDPIQKEFDFVGPVSNAPFQMKVNQETGNIWYTTLNKNKIGIIQKNIESEKTLQISEFDIGHETHPSGIFVHQNQLWITQLFDNKGVHYSIIRDSSGIVTDIKKIQDIPKTKSGPFVAIPASPTDIIIVNDNLWVTEHGTSFVAKYDTKAREWKRYPTSQAEFEATSLPFWMRTSDNGFWFNEHTGNKISFFNTTETSMTEYEVPGKPSRDFVIQLLNLATNPEENNVVWFTEWNLDKVSSINGNTSLPFDIKAKTDKIVINKDQNKPKEIEIEIRPNYNEDNFKKEYNLKSSSTIGIAGDFINMTAKFSTDSISSETLKEKTATVKLLLSDYSNAPTGTYMIGISITDRTVTKTDFVELIIR